MERLVLNKTPVTPLELDSPPRWFASAVTQPRSEHAVLAGKVRLHVAGWNDDDTAKPPLLLVHGFRANSHWWDHIAPFLTQERRVFALDLSGMGQSGRRAVYTRSDFTADIVAVALWVRDLAPGLPLTVAGHSYGGSRALEVCAQMPGLIDHAIVLDAPVPLRGDRSRNVDIRSRVEPYPDRQSILERFRLSPEQPSLPFIKSYIAEQSIVRLKDGGWSWQFDPAIHGGIGGYLDRDDALRRISGRVDVVRGADSSIVSAEMATRIAALIPGARGPFEIPEAHHHLMLDHPLALVRLLRSLLDFAPAEEPMRDSVR